MQGSVIERLREIVASSLGVEREQIVPEARILDDLGADSLDVVELAMTLEETFGIVVPDEAIERLRTIGDVELYVSARA